MGRGRVVMDGSEAVAMLGTGQDVTEQRQVERLREDILGVARASHAAYVRPRHHLTREAPRHPLG